MESEFLCALSPSAQQEMRCRHRGADQMMCHTRSEDLWLRSSRWNLLSSYVAPVIDQTSCCLQSSAAIHLLKSWGSQMPMNEQGSCGSISVASTDHAKCLFFWISTNTPKYENLLAVSNWKAVYTNREQYLLKEIILFSTQLVQICTQDSTAIPKAAGSRVWYWESSYFRWTETWRGEDPQKGYLETMDGWQKTYAESCFPQLFFSNSFRVGIFKCLAFLVP